MASRCRSVSRPALNLLKSTMNKPTPRPGPIPSLRTPLSSPTFQRSLSQLGSLQSLLPLYSAVSSARLTSCLGIDSKGSRSLSQELGLSVPR
ncbi:protein NONRESPONDING TO OXYLIPINS 2, mitochondrial isoform X2 [Cornus florida]|uniref:protein NONRESPONDING TO OXYLIPINS 2, mitochondrial isoform X2 n=1 Tax=Cornus florida TaxID=4283 RepID=UPI0028A1CCC8|nr:protein NONRESPONDING TO OXYLIPINS 2, mitochondrial isoform X2 [Cornus florida]